MGIIWDYRVCLLENINKTSTMDFVHTYERTLVWSYLNAFLAKKSKILLTYMSQHMHNINQIQICQLCCKDMCYVTLANLRAINFSET